MRKLIYTTLSFLIVFLSGCNDSDAGKGVFAESEDVNIATWLETEGNADFSQWVSLLKYTDLYNTMNLRSSYTCFVPNNQAMSRFLSANNYASVESIDPEYARTLVKYHTIAGKTYTWADFEDGIIPDTTATGDFLSITIRDGGVNAVYVNNQSRINRMDVELTNGVVHGLDDVMTPVTETIYDFLNHPDYSVFRDAVEAVGYQELLSQTQLVNEAGILYRPKKTLFLESNATFQQQGIGSFEQLKQYLSDRGETLERFVGYHLLDRQLGYSEFASANRYYETLLGGEFLNFRDKNGTLLINYDTQTDKGIQLLSYNVNCKNGLVHLLDDVLSIMTPALSTITWELTDYSEVAALYSSVYRLKSLSSSSLNWIQSESVSCYRWMVVPESNKDYSIAYFVSQKGDAVRIKAQNYDYLRLWLGMSGYIEMNTPTLLKGTYNVSVKYYSPQATSKTGLLSFIFDGEYLGSQIALNGNSKTAATYVTTNLGTLTFEDTEKHLLRILAGDNSSVDIDCIVFTPVK